MACLVEPALAATVAANHLACIVVAVLGGVTPLVVANGADVGIGAAATPADLRIQREVGVGC
jgi:hypothetical protein